MQRVPTYQVVEFLEWMTKRYRIPHFEDQRLLLRYATEYLEHELLPVTEISLELLLVIFQGCNRIEDESLEAQMLHFLRCGGCMKYDIYVEMNQGEFNLHPYLVEFVSYINHNYPEIPSDISNYNDINRRNHTKRPFDDFLMSFPFSFGRQLHEAFLSFYKKSDTNLIQDYIVYSKSLRNHGEKTLKHRDIHWGHKNMGNLNPKDRSIKAEAERLYESVVNYLKDPSINSTLYFYARRMGAQNIATLEFFDWLQDKQPELKITGDIPANKLDELVEAFCDDAQYSNILELKSEIEKLFTGKAPSSLMRRVRRWLFEKGDATAKKENPFERYKHVQYHAMFLYTSYGEGNLDSFINDTWRDLNSLTSDYLDIYFSEEDINKRNGFDVLNQISALRSINVTQIPALILWEKTMKQAVSLPLGNLSKREIFQAIQHLVQAIKDGHNLDYIGECVIEFINSKLESTNVKSIEIIMGDKNKIIKSQVVAVGTNSNATVKKQKQINLENRIIDDLDYSELSKQLEALGNELAKNAQTLEQRVAVGLVAQAEQAAKNQNGKAVLKSLKSAGYWVFNTAKDIGVELAAEVIKKQMEG